MLGRHWIKTRDRGARLRHRHRGFHIEETAVSPHHHHDRHRTWTARTSGTLLRRFSHITGCRRSSRNGSSVSAAAAVRAKRGPRRNHQGRARAHCVPDQARDRSAHRPRFRRKCRGSAPARLLTPMITHGLLQVVERRATARDRQRSWRPNETANISPTRTSLWAALLYYHYADTLSLFIIHGTARLQGSWQSALHIDDDR